jgi:hypothetical protein
VVRPAGGATVFISLNNLMNKLLVLIFLVLNFQAIAQQHQHHEGMPMTGQARPVKADSVKAVYSSEKGMNELRNDGMTMGTSMPDTSMPGMTHSLSRYLPMNRNGSGTSWHPDNTPMYAYMSQPSGRQWSYMLHYAVYLRYTSQNSNNPGGRGRAQQLGAPNWVMGMAQKKVGQKGLFQVRAMVSLDPLTVSNGGYPLLFQTGETYKDQPLIDKQHPHDLVSELSVSYSHSFNKDMDLFGYVGYPGEPALGPPAFMHRISSFNNPDAPLSHHWQDATHILFGVATVGFRYKWAKLEASSFTGRESDENRYDFDRPRFDSYSYRLSVNPSPSLAFQFSQGYLRSPEVAHPEENVTRTTASVLHSKGLGSPGRYVTSALTWGMNSHNGENENAFLAESSLQIDKIAVYGRYENVGKSAEELSLAGQAERLGYDDHAVFTINNLTLGMNYRLAQQWNTDLVLGAQVTGALTDQFLQTVYGKTPLSGQIYLRLSPSLMTMGSMKSRHKGMNGMHH